MILSDRDIKKYVQDGKIIIKPELKEEDIRPTGIRLHLGDKLLVPEPGQTVDLTNISDIKYKEVTIPETGFVLEPNAFVLGTTLENYQFPYDIIGQLDGRSTYARLGLTIHITAEMVDGNYRYPGSTVLEMKNLGIFNLILKPKMQIGMLLFHQLLSPVENPANFKYQNQNSVLPPEADKE